MKWNDNDTKYIFKRLLLYLIITGIIFFTGTRCAKAQETIILNVYQNNILKNALMTDTQVEHIVFGSPITTEQQLKGKKGILVFSFLVGPATANSNAVLQEVGVRAYNGSQRGPYFPCDIENMQTYVDNSKYNNVITATCPIQFSSGWYLGGILFKRANSTGQIAMSVNEYGYFIEDSGAPDYSAITNAQQQTTQQMQNIFNQMMNEGSYIRNTITNSATQAHADAQQAHSDSQAEQQAINDNTQAVNDLNNNIMQDYDVPDDIDDSFEFSNWFSQQDSDFIRGILLFPLRIFYLISGALDSNSCIEYHFGRLYGYELKLPCINYKQYIGNTIYLMIDTIFALVIVFGLIRYMISLYDFVFSVGLKGASVVSAVEVFK